jgi:hypothetical protein
MPGVAAPITAFDSVNGSAAVAPAATHPVIVIV